MLQIFSYYGVHEDVYTQSFFAGSQSSNLQAANDYLSSYLTTLNHFFDDSVVFQTVHLCNDESLIPRYSLFDFKINQTGNDITQVVLCNKCFLEGLIRSVSCQKVEHVRDIGRQILPACKETEVFIKLRCIGIVITGADMEIASQAPMLFPNDNR